MAPWMDPRLHLPAPPARDTFATVRPSMQGDHDARSGMEEESIVPPALPGPVRTLVERIFPPGALILSVLTFGYFAMGIVRNRVFANTYGAGAELDAYNAAFRIPEIALDVLVAAGLTAPFVPIFTSLRRGGDAAANDFGRTVLTGAVIVMSVAIGLIFLLAPWLATQVGRGFDAPTQELYVQL